MTMTVFELDPLNVAAALQHIAMGDTLMAHVHGRVLHVYGLNEQRNEYWVDDWEPYSVLATDIEKLIAYRQTTSPITWQWDKRGTGRLTDIRTPTD